MKYCLLVALLLVVVAASSAGESDDRSMRRPAPMCKKRCPRGFTLKPFCKCVPKKNCRVRHFRCKGKKKCGYRLRRVCKKTGHKCKHRTCKPWKKKVCGLIHFRKCTRKRFGWLKIRVCKPARRKHCRTYKGKRCFVKNKVCHRTTCKTKRSKVCWHGRRLCRVRTCHKGRKPIRLGRRAPRKRWGF